MDTFVRVVSGIASKGKDNGMTDAREDIHESPEPVLGHVQLPKAPEK